MTALAPITNADSFRASTDAAGLCRDIVLKTASKIQGRRFVTVEGWQSIAVAHGCVASAIDVHRVNDEGCEGFAATGVLRRMSDGVEIGRAEGFVGDDERTWGKRDVYARRAMAQTRAISRVCRSAFAHVVLMMDAGLMTTPAEEMPVGGDVIEHEPANDMPGKVEGITKIKDRLRKLQTEGNTATDLGAFNALVHAAADDLTKIKDAKHDWWTGDGGEMEGFKAWIVRRREELGPDNMVSRMIADMKECSTRTALSRWLGAHNDAIEALDGADARRFQLACDLHESALGAEATVTAG